MGEGEGSRRGEEERGGRAGRRRGEEERGWGGEGRGRSSEERRRGGEDGRERERSSEENVVGKGRRGVIEERSCKRQVGSRGGRRRGGAGGREGEYSKNRWWPEIFFVVFKSVLY